MNTANSSDANTTTKTACPICGGAGFLRRDVPVDHPDFGRAIPCECKVRETQQADLSALRQSSGLTLNQMTFDSFRPDGIGLNPDKRKNLRYAHDTAREYARNPKGWLLLKGGYGCGKTHLVAAMANDRLARGEPVMLVVVPDLLDHLRATFAPTSRVTYDDRFETIRSTPFLILDDMGAQSATAWAQEKLFQLLNHRYNSQLPTVITTNRELEEIDPRLRSRLADSTLSTIVTILAPDFRQGGIDSSSTGVSSLAIYGDMTFDAFNLRNGELAGSVRDNLRRMFEDAKRYAESPIGFIVFSGEYGCGKTHLAAAIAHTINRRGYDVLFRTVPDLLDHLRATFAPGSLTQYDQVFEDTRTSRVLVLDDLGTENATPWAREKLFQIIDYRYVLRLPTIITIHIHAEIDPRIQTRIFDIEHSIVCEIEAPTYRTAHRSTQGKAENGYRRTRR